MTLATRCPACGTTFRVVQDQLKVSEGWVRCGRCSEVFSALESLVDIAPRPGPAGLPTKAPETRVAAPLPPAIDMDDDFVDHVAVQTPAELDPGQAPSLIAPEAIPQSDGGPAGTAPAPPAQDDAFTSISSVVPGAKDWPAETADFPAAPDDRVPNTMATPGFLREAERAAHWRRPGVRAALALTSLTLAMALGLQTALTYRDTFASRWPAARPLLTEACRMAGCRIEPLRDIGAVAVESSGLSQLDGTTVYRLSLVLRNRAAWAVMAPAVDLMLTDVQGRVLARKVMTVTELGSPSGTIDGRAELALQANLSTGERRVTGYKIEIFHP